MFDFLRLWSGLLIRLVRCRRSLLIENLALRQQLAAFKRQNSRPRLATAGKIFWVLLLRSWSLWKTALIVMSPDPVVRWHRAGLQRYWRFISRVRKPVGRRPVTKEIRDPIFQMVAESPTWRAPRIHGELAMLGFDVSERSVSRWMQRAPRTPESGQRWLIFLRNHREAIAAMDFFSVPTVTFNVLCVFFIIGHDRRRNLNCTRLCWRNDNRIPAIRLPVVQMLHRPRRCRVSSLRTGVSNNTLTLAWPLHCTEFKWVNLYEMMNPMVLADVEAARLVDDRFALALPRLPPPRHETILFSAQLACSILIQPGAT
jgi:hypothetical protein